MRLLVTFLLLISAYYVYPQACRMPASLDQMRPDKCGIRHVKSEGDKIKVILEFEKKTRIITPENPNDVRGKLVNLIGLYYLTYDRTGEIIDENKVFVQTGDVPAKGLVFGLDGQKGQLLDAELTLLSLADYAQVPWGGGITRHENKSATVSERKEFHFETALNVDKNLKLIDLQIVKWQHQVDEVDSTALIRKKASLIEFDSASKKQYWINQYMPVTDPHEGFTLALLNNVNKDIDKDISEKLLRLVSFDTNGQVAGSHELEFPANMHIVYRNEIYTPGGHELDKQIMVLKAKEASPDAYKLGQYYYYWFDKKAQLQSSAVVVSKHDIFHTNNILWQPEGVFYMSNTEHEIVSCYIQNTGKYNIYTSGSKTRKLKDFLDTRGVDKKGNVSLALIGEPTVFENGEVLMIYRVQEDVGVMAGMQISPEMAAATRVDHGLVPVLLRPDGQIIAAQFYQRPINSDPRSLVEIGPIERNSDGVISFYATDQTSEGLFPVLCSINGPIVSFVRSEEGPTIARLIYYDPQEEVVGYFGRKKDPANPKISVRTLEILRVDD